MKNKIITLLFILFSSLAFSQLSKVHYIPPITSGPSNANPEDQYLYISTPIKGDVNITINIIGSGSQSQVISNDNPWIYTISQDGYSSLVQDPETTSQVTNDKGFIVESDSPIYVSARLNAGGAQAGALVSKGENALGTTFRIGTYDNQGSVSSNYMNFFSFMATEDNTIVNLSNNLTNGFDFENSSEQFPFNNIILNRGESYVLAARADKASANRAGLIGTLISSSKPIVVNTGSANGSFGTGGARDYGIDQIVDLSKVGKEYIFVKGNGENSYENVLIVVHEDNTEIFVNGDSKATRNSGEYYIVEGDQFINDNMYVNTSNDTFVYQGIGGTNSEANQGMFFVPPLSCGSRGDVDNIPYIDKIGNLTFTGGITIVTKENSEVIINGDEISSQPGGVNVTGPTSVTAKNSYVTYKVTGLTGNVSVSSSDELYVSYFNLNGAAASGSFFSGFASNPSLDLNLSATKLGSCISEAGTSNIELNVSNNGNFDSVQWEKKNADNTWSSITGQTNSQFTPTQIGTYRVKGIIACDGETVEYYSSEIPISQCPDDFDGDGIINNLDLDQDNDGILNSVESRGIGNIDFSNTASPTINLSDGTAINGAISGLVNGDGSLSGQNQSFEMQVEAGVDQELKYALTFTENLNINVKDNQNVSVAIRNGESFIIKSSPDSSNITLLDPSNNLLVDTNFDDEFENNVTEFTSNEIRFKFNTNSTATIDYELFATKIDGVTFTHKYSTTETGESVFVPNVYVYDYKNDSDGDGNEDMFEIDSDNDGCNDIIEADFTALENYQGDLDNDGIYGDGTQTFDNGLVNSRGLIKVHNDADGYNTDPKKDSNGNYLFQIAGNPVQIIDEPSSTEGCEGSTVEFEVNATSDGGGISYQWQFFNLENSSWDNLSDSDFYSGTSSSKLIISSISTSMDGRYRVALKSDTYLCKNYSDSNINLAVNTPPAPAVVEPIQTFCLTDSPTVGDLEIAPAPANPADLIISVYDGYDPNDTSVGSLLDDTDLLTDGTIYFIQVTDSQGCIGVSRSETKVLLPNPIITPSVGESCVGDEITITVSGVPQTALDFELSNPTLTKILADYTDNEGRLSSYFVDPDSKSFSQAENLLPSYGTGASMYQINDLNEHDAVWNAIVEKNLDGQVPLWLGLKQFPALNPNQTFDEGWYWLDGRELDPTWNLWQNGEPNDYDLDKEDSDGIDDGTEDYGHFNLAGAGKFLNDYPEGVASRPLYEFSGTTTVRWYYEDPSNTGTFIDIPVNASTLTLNPDVTTTYFIDVTTNGIVCSTSYTHVVNPLPIPNKVDDIYLCDEVDLTNSDSTSTDGISYSFDLESQTTTIVNEQIDRDNNPLTVTYHATLTEAEVGENPITSPYTNVLDPDGNLYDPQTIYIRILNNATGCYDATETFNIIVNSTPESFPALMPEACDDTESGSDVDGSSKFDLTILNDDILGPDQVAIGGFKVTYHLTQEEANDPITNPNGIADPTAHYNTPESTFDSSNPTVQTEEIFVRVTDTNSSTLCFRADTSFVLTVNPLPVILNPIWKVEQCDNPLFDLTDYDEKLSTYFDNETFTYFNEAGEEISLDDAKNYTSSSTSVDPEIIDVVFTKNVGGCFRTAQIELKVSYSQVPSDFAQTFIANNQSDLFQSESDSDLTGQTQDGKEEFNTNIFNNIITELKAQAPLAFDIPGINFEFYGSQRDATLRNNEIDISQSTYTNEVETPDIATGNLTSNYNVIYNRWEQEIWVYIENTNLSIIQSSCVGLEHVTTLYVEKRPVIYDVLDTTGTNPNEILLLCDEQITLDRYSVFDTSTLQNLLLGNTTDPLITPYQDISTFDVEYTYLDDDGITSITSNTLPGTINLTNQEINVTLTNTVGVTAPFVSSSSVSFQVFQTPTPFSGIKLEECDDEESGADDDGISVFDIDIDSFKNSLFIDPTDTSSTSVQDFNDFEFNFSLYDNNDVLLSGPTNTLDSKISAEDGYYIISEISNPLSTELGLSCESSVRTDFIVNPLPNFDIDEEMIVCLNPLPDNPLEIGTYNWNGGNDPTIYNYTWSRVDLIGNQDSDFIENTQTIKVDKGGVYTVIVEDAITFCTRSKSITVTESEMAKISLDDITVDDLKNDNTNTITIDTLNLGIGDYEFSLDEAFGPYQDEPVFESVKPGIHTIYIRDKNSYYTYDYGCGIAQIDVSVIGYRKYFTPNGDGINETWKILGIRSDFNAGSKVYIFDRFGKLLKELDPLSQTDGMEHTLVNQCLQQTTGSELT